MAQELTLRPYQQDAIQAVQQHWAGGHPNVLGTAATGAGKTLVFLELLTRQMRAHGGRGLILAHRKELVEQPIERLEQFWPEWVERAGIVMAERDDCDKDLVLATVQTLMSRRRLARLLAHGPIQWLITDECFVAGTLVDGRPIEAVGIGDEVTCIGPHGPVRGQVTQKHVRPAPDTLYVLEAGDRQVVCTGNHPFLTPCGWMRADSLREGDRVGVWERSPREARRGLRGADQRPEYRTLPPVCGQNEADASGDPDLLRVPHNVRARQGAGGHLAKGGTGPLLPGLLLPGLFTCGIGTDGCRAHGGDEPPIRGAANARTQPDARSACAGKDGTYPAPDRAPAGQAAREWYGTDYPAGVVGAGSGLAHRGRRVHRLLRAGGGRAPLSLPSGPGQPFPQTGHRGGWGLARLARAQGAGRPEGRPVAWARLDRVTVLQRGGDGGFERLCPDGLVHNLGVAPYHNYLANGFVVHNCHHAVADTYGRVYEALYAANPEMRHLGVTATPIRADGSGLVAVYDAEAFHYGIKEMVRMGYLVPPRWLAIATGISLQGVQKVAGDYSAKSLAHVYETENCFDLVVASHQKYAQGRQAIAFTPTVEGAYRLADKFTAAGVPAEAADGTTAKSDRADILAGFRRGETEVLVNVGLYTEGLDVPEVSCIHMVRPTKSDGLYVQCVGRGLRSAPGKNDCLILDYCPVEVRNVSMLGDVLGVAATKDAYLEPEKRDQEGEVLGGFTFDGDTKWLRGDPMELVSRQLRYIDLSPVSWHRQGGWLTVGLGKASDGLDRSLVISKPDSEGVATLWQVAKEDRSWDAEVMVLAHGTWDALTLRAEEVTDRFMNAALAAKDRAWRTQMASEAQIRFARKLGVWSDARPMTKGETAQAITHALAMQAVLGRNWQQQVMAQVAGAGDSAEMEEIRASVCA